MANKNKIVIWEYLTGELVDLYHDEFGCIGRNINERQFNDVRIQIAKEEVSGYYILWNDKRIDIDKNGDMSDFPVGLYDHVSTALAEIYTIVQNRKKEDKN